MSKSQKAHAGQQLQTLRSELVVQMANLSTMLLTVPNFAAATSAELEGFYELAESIAATVLLCRVVGLAHSPVRPAKDQVARLAALHVLTQPVRDRAQPAEPEGGGG